MAAFVGLAVAMGRALRFGDACTPLFTGVVDVATTVAADVATTVGAWPILRGGVHGVVEDDAVDTVGPSSMATSRMTAGILSQMPLSLHDHGCGCTAAHLFW